MTSDPILARVRAANPSRTAHAADDALFTSIVAGPADPRLAKAASPSRRRARVIQIAAAAALAMVIAAGAAWATGRDVLQLFASNPAAGDGQTATGLWHQVAIESTVRQAGVISIPHYGQLELWYAETEQGGWCGALRLPDGSWAGTKGAGSGGTAPGCYPSRTQVNEAGGSPVFVITGFDYYDVDIDARDKGGRYWRIVYGVTEGKTPAARVVDTVSGRRATILSGRVFALGLPDDTPEQSAPGRMWHLVAYGPAGDVIADADKALKPRP